MPLYAQTNSTGPSGPQRVQCGRLSHPGGVGELRESAGQRTECRDCQTSVPGQSSSRRTVSLRLSATCVNVSHKATTQIGPLNPDQPTSPTPRVDQDAARKGGPIAVLL